MYKIHLLSFHFILDFMALHEKRYVRLLFYWPDNMKWVIPKIVTLLPLKDRDLKFKLKILLLVKLIFCVFFTVWHKVRTENRKD